MGSGANGHGNGADHGVAHEPLSAQASTEIRRGVGRLITGANELAVIALVSPAFILGAYLATAGFARAGHGGRDAGQGPLDYALFGGYGVVLVALAIRARLGAGRARKLLPDALSDDRNVRAATREKILRLAGTLFMRELADWIASKGCLLVVIFAVVAVGSWWFLPIPDPVWLVVFVGTAIAMDVRWRALVVDVADQMPL